MEQSIIDKLQKDAEQEIGSMPEQRGEIPSLELLFKFYRFYIIKSPANIDTKESMMLTLVCSKSKKHIVDVAEKHYDINNINFIRKFHDWNKINNPNEY